MICQDNIYEYFYILEDILCAKSFLAFSLYQVMQEFSLRLPILHLFTIAFSLPQCIYLSDLLHVSIFVDLLC